MYDPECPYCGAKQEINHDDGYGCNEDESYEQECHECRKIYAFTVDYLIVYETRAAPFEMKPKEDKKR